MTTKKAGKIRAAVVRETVAAAVAAVPASITGPVAVPPVPKPAPVPALELAVELWNGAAGKFAFSGTALSSGRWCVAAMALRGEDRRKLLTLADFTRLHNRQLKAWDLPAEDHPISWAAPGDAAAVVLQNMLTAEPGTWPARKTDVVLDLPDYAIQFAFPGTFFRVYVSTDPANPAPVLLPDYYLVNLGDPVELWPAVQKGFWTDGQYVATQGTAPEATAAAVAAVRDLVAAIGPAAL